jgi:hypothetical protein
MERVLLDHAGGFFYTFFKYLGNLADAPECFNVRPAKVLQGQGNFSGNATNF